MGITSMFFVGERDYKILSLKNLKDRLIRCVWVSEFIFVASLFYIRRERERNLRDWSKLDN